MYENNVPGTTPFVPGSTTPGAVGGPIPGTAPGFAPSAAPNPFFPPVAPAPAPGPDFSTALKPVQNREPDIQYDPFVTPYLPGAEIILDPRKTDTIETVIIPVTVFSKSFNCVIEGKLLMVNNLEIYNGEDFIDVVSHTCENQNYVLMHMGKPTQMFAYADWRQVYRMVNDGIRSGGFLFMDRIWDNKLGTPLHSRHGYN